MFEVQTPVLIELFFRQVWISVWGLGVDIAGSELGARAFDLGYMIYGGHSCDT